MSPSLLGMNQNIDKIYNLLEPLLDGTDIFVVSIKVKPTNNVKIFLDADSGFTVEKCIQINRALYPKIDASGIYPPGDFSLEVSSPGVDEPIVQIRQYKKNIGRKLAVTDLEGKETIGILKEMKEEVLVLEVQFTKPKEIKLIEIPIVNIKKAVVQIVF